MMRNWLLSSSADRRLLGATNLRGPTPWLIAIMSFSIMIVAAAGLALTNTAGLLTRAIEARYSVELPNGGDRLDRLVQIVRSAPGVASAEAVPEQDMRRTLARWLGPEASNRDLPVPALVNFDVHPGASLQRVEAAVRKAAPDASIVSHGENLRPLLGSLRVLQWLAFGLVLLLSVAASAAVVLAARGALDTHRSTIEVMHGIGATDLQVTHLFQRRIALDALAGSLIGAACAGLVLVLLSAGARFAGEFTGGATLNLLDLVALFVLPFALAAMATWVARSAVLATLRRSL
jgi:cell division transport system permease protein